MLSCLKVKHILGGGHLVGNQYPRWQLAGMSYSQDSLTIVVVMVMLWLPWRCQHCADHISLQDKYSLIHWSRILSSGKRNHWSIFWIRHKVKVNWESSKSQFTYEFKRFQNNISDFANLFTCQLVNSKVLPQSYYEVSPVLYLIEKNTVTTKATAKICVWYQRLHKIGFVVFKLVYLVDFVVMQTHWVAGTFNIYTSRLLEVDHQWFRHSVGAWSVFSPISFSKPMLNYCQLDPGEQNSINFESK